MVHGHCCSDVGCGVNVEAAGVVGCVGTNWFVAHVVGSMNEEKCFAGFGGMAGCSGIVGLGRVACFAGLGKVVLGGMMCCKVDRGLVGM